MEINFWKRAAVGGLVALALAGCASKKAEGPVFATRAPVAATKPDAFAFKHSIQVKDLEGLQEKVQRNLATVLSTDDFTKSLRQSLANDEMLAAAGIEGEYELIPTFVDLRTAPVSEGVTAAQAIFDYRVVRAEDNTEVFNRRIKAEFTSIADSAYENGGLFSRTLRFVGLRGSGAKPLAATRGGADETKGPGPKRDSAREIHAARSAIALNIRKAMRYIIASSPERLVAPQTATPSTEENAAQPGAGGKPVKIDNVKPLGADVDAADSGEEDTPDEDGAPEEAGDDSMPPIAPESNDSGQ